ncbi:gamma-glutamyl-gamma-aminobutyrate hydrolase family protein [Arthrobacter sp. PAMC25284]|uniref:gamma-glutamyl-gamma-aminobutyrate hydrolase family protein n=1 Tax=Arthrobacter sp. PAMC25284 TaxID=2861279 RepID=UPI0035C263E6
MPCRQGCGSLRPSADGTVQALESADPSGWLLGVQFHPEQNPEDLRLFRGFVQAAGSYRANRKEMSTL